MRTHFCGLVDEALIGQTVTLCGWADVARNMGQIVFIDLRDHEGVVQVVAEPADAAGNAAVLEAAGKVGYEDCLRITGTVRRRQNPNPKIPTPSRARTRLPRCRSTSRPTRSISSPSRRSC